MPDTRLVSTFGEEYTLLTNSQDVEATLESIGYKDDDYSSLFVKVGEGEYLEVWGMESSVPYTYRNAWRIQ